MLTLAARPLACSFSRYAIRFEMRYGSRNFLLLHTEYALEKVKSAQSSAPHWYAKGGKSTLHSITQRVMTYVMTEEEGM
jgi:hypothetical protein